MVEKWRNLMSPIIYYKISRVSFMAWLKRWVTKNLTSCFRINSPINDIFQQTCINLLNSRTNLNIHNIHYIQLWVCVVCMLNLDKMCCRLVSVLGHCLHVSYIFGMSVSMSDYEFICILSHLLQKIDDKIS